MQLISKHSKGIRYLFCVIDLSSKYTWVVPLQNKKGVSIVNAFKSISKKSRRKPNKMWVDQGSEFYSNVLKKFLKDSDIVCIQHIMKESLLLLKDLLKL